MDPREGRPDHGGRDRHVAVTIADIDVLVSSPARSEFHFKKNAPAHGAYAYQPYYCVCLHSFLLNSQWVTSKDGLIVSKIVLHVAALQGSQN
jgi:hypothetical protein